MRGPQATDWQSLAVAVHTEVFELQLVGPTDTFLPPFVHLEESEWLSCSLSGPLPFPPNVMSVIRVTTHVTKEASQSLQGLKAVMREGSSESSEAGMCP